MKGALRRLYRNSESEHFFMFLLLSKKHRFSDFRDVVHEIKHPDWLILIKIPSFEHAPNSLDFDRTSPIQLDLIPIAILPFSRLQSNTPHWDELYPIVCPLRLNQGIRAYHLHTNRLYYRDDKKQASIDCTHLCGFNAW